MVDTKFFLVTYCPSFLKAKEGRHGTAEFAYSDLVFPRMGRYKGGVRPAVIYLWSALLASIVTVYSELGFAEGSLTRYKFVSSKVYLFDPAWNRVDYHAESKLS